MGYWPLGRCISYHKDGGCSMAHGQVFLGVRKSFQKMEQVFLFVQKKSSAFPWQKTKQIQIVCIYFDKHPGIFWNPEGFFQNRCLLGSAAGGHLFIIKINQPTSENIIFRIDSRIQEAPSLRPCRPCLSRVTLRKIAWKCLVESSSQIANIKQSQLQKQN